MKLARLSLAALFLAATACSSVQQVRDPVQFLATNPAHIVVTYEDNSEVPVVEPRLRNDTIIGTWEGLSEPVALPLSRIQRVDAIQKDSKRTTLLIFALAGVTAAATYGFVRAVQDHGMICDYNRPTGPSIIDDAGQCYTSSGGGN
jgi:hypothetical protein